MYSPKMCLMCLMCLLMLFVVVAGLAEASPVITPYAIRQSTSYEGGYRLDLEVCDEVLCKLDVVLPNKRFGAPKEKLSSIADPDIHKVEFFVDISKEASDFVRVYVPVADFDKKIFPNKKIFVLEFSDGKLKNMEVIYRPEKD